MMPKKIFATHIRLMIILCAKPKFYKLIQSDVSTAEGTKKIINVTLEKLGGLDVLVNNVGGSSSSTAGALALSDED
jgi:NADP-dependent 3-hydroxy acid dehydrogenase YdfG